MAQITLIEPQKRDGKRCNIYIDGKFYCGIKLEVAIKYNLKVGMEVDKSKLDEIQLETEKSQAVDKAMTHLSASMKTRKQMSDFLLKKGYTQAVVDYVLEKLEYYNLVDDYAYCRAFVNSVSGKGKRALEAELYKRGAQREAIEEALSDFEEDGEEVKTLLQKYLRGKEITKENLNKGYKYLLSKGYNYDTIKDAISNFGVEDEDY